MSLSALRTKSLLSAALTQTHEIFVAVLGHMLLNGLMGSRAIKQDLDPRRGGGCVTTSLCFDIIIHPCTTQQKRLNLIHSGTGATDTSAGTAVTAASKATARGREDPRPSIAVALFSVSRASSGHSTCCRRNHAGHRAPRPAAVCVCCSFRSWCSETPRSGERTALFQSP